MYDPGRLTLVGDGIENPANVRSLLNAAAMFGCGSFFRGGASWKGESAPEVLPRVSFEELVGGFDPMLALDNGEGAESIFGFRAPVGARPVLVVGNERRGISREVKARANRLLQIPMFAPRLNTLNVAAAAAVALYYLRRKGGGAMKVSANPARRRPQLLLFGSRDHFELGSSIRSAGAFGWERVLVDDRERVWFGADRARATEARAAARRSRNQIRVSPFITDADYVFDEVCVVTTRPVGEALTRANLARGPRQLVVVADEEGEDLAAGELQRWGRRTRYVRLDTVPSDWRYQLRLIATIAMAEIARQVGQKPRTLLPQPERRRPVYKTELQIVPDEDGEIVFLDELEAY